MKQKKEQKTKYGKCRYRELYSVSEKVPYQKNSGKLYIIQLQCQQATQVVQHLNESNEVTNEFEISREVIRLKTLVKDFRADRWFVLNSVRAEDSAILQKVLDRFTDADYDVKEEAVEVSSE